MNACLIDAWCVYVCSSYVMFLSNDIHEIDDPVASLLIVVTLMTGSLLLSGYCCCFYLMAAIALLLPWPYLSLCLHDICHSYRCWFWMHMVFYTWLLLWCACYAVVSFFLIWYDIFYWMWLSFVAFSLVCHSIALIFPVPDAACLLASSVLCSSRSMCVPLIFSHLCSSSFLTLLQWSPMSLSLLSFWFFCCHATLLLFWLLLCCSPLLSAALSLTDHLILPLAALCLLPCLLTFPTCFLLSLLFDAPLRRCWCTCLPILVLSWLFLTALLIDALFLQAFSHLFFAPACVLPCLCALVLLSACWPIWGNSFSSPLCLAAASLLCPVSDALSLPVCFLLLILFCLLSSFCCSAWPFSCYELLVPVSCSSACSVCPLGPAVSLLLHILLVKCSPPICCFCALFPMLLSISFPCSSVSDSRYPLFLSLLLALLFHACFMIWFVQWSDSLLLALHCLSMLDDDNLTYLYCSI